MVKNKKQTTTEDEIETDKSYESEDTITTDESDTPLEIITETVVIPEDVTKTLDDTPLLELDPMNEHPKYTKSWFSRKWTTKEHIYTELLFSEQAKKEAGYRYDKLLQTTLMLFEAMRSFSQDSKEVLYQIIMSVIVQDGKNIFNCPKCATKFTEISSRHVRISNCGHIYCPKCLEGLQKIDSPCITCGEGMVRAPFIEDLQDGDIFKRSFKRKKKKKKKKRRSEDTDTDADYEVEDTVKDISKGKRKKKNVDHKKVVLETSSDEIQLSE